MSNMVVWGYIDDNINYLYPHLVHAARFMIYLAHFKSWKDRCSNFSKMVPKISSEIILFVCIFSSTKRSNLLTIESKLTRSFAFTFLFMEGVLSLDNSKISSYGDRTYPIEITQKNRILKIQHGPLYTLAHTYIL